MERETKAIRDHARELCRFVRQVTKKVLCGGILWDFVAALGIRMWANISSGSCESVT